MLQEYLRVELNEAFSWLRDGGFEDLIKNTVTTSFNRGQDNQVAELSESV